MKKIIISTHARLGMLNRGASEEDVKTTVESGERKEAKRGKLKATKTFPFNGISSVNGKHYALKTIEAIIADEPEEITVVTIKVYYHNE